MPLLQFDDITARNKGKTGFVAGLGSSLFGPSRYSGIGNGTSSINNAPKMVDRIIRDFDIVRRVAENIGIQIFGICGTGQLAEVFPFGVPELV